MRLEIQLSKDLQKLMRNGFNIRDRIQKAQLRATIEVQNKAKELAPYLTGSLRRSITSDFGRIKQGISVVGSPLPYARIRHYINKKNPHTIRYLERGFTENVQLIQSIFREEFMK